MAEYYAQIDVGFGTIVVEGIEAETLKEAAIIATTKAWADAELKRAKWPEADGHDLKLRVWRRYD